MRTLVNTLFLVHARYNIPLRSYHYHKPGLIETLQVYIAENGDHNRTGVWIDVAQVIPSSNCQPLFIGIKLVEHV